MSPRIDSLMDMERVREIVSWFTARHDVSLSFCEGGDRCILVTWEGHTIGFKEGCSTWRILEMLERLIKRNPVGSVEWWSEHGHREGICYDHKGERHVLEG